ncbi:MAG: hypothetical protein UHS52_01510, partial [Alistipes sp.]|nr:hypothetical protein [Alistipes sp.]
MNKDTQIFDLIAEERSRQTKGIELIASENFVSDQVMAAMGSVCTNKYAEGYPAARYYGGCEVVDKIENQNVAYNLDRRAGEGRWEKPGDVTSYVGFSATGANTPASTRFIMNDNEIRFATILL